MLLQRQSGFLQLESTIPLIVHIITKYKITHYQSCIIEHLEVLEIEKTILNPLR
jgi:hypothetical protein